MDKNGGEFLMTEGWKECPRCGTEHRNDEYECDNCGWIFHNKRCPRCGKYLPDYVKICYDCGWYFYWEEYIGEDDHEQDYGYYSKRNNKNYKYKRNYKRHNYDVDDYEDDVSNDYPSFSEYWSDILDVNFENDADLGQYMDDLGYDWDSEGRE